MERDSVDAAHPIDRDLFDEELVLEEFDRVRVDLGGRAGLGGRIEGGRFSHRARLPDRADPAEANRDAPAATATVRSVNVLELWRYPVKSMGGQSVPSVAVAELGVDGDRRFGVLDVETGTVLTARRAPQLLFATARVVDNDVRVSVPGVESELPVDEADEALSSLLDRRVRIAAAGEEGGTYEVPLDAENDENWVSWTGPGGAWHDSGRSRVSLLSIGSVGDWDLRRFRANIIVSGNGEDAFVGGRVVVGDVVLDVNKRIDRCVMVTRPQPGLERDLDVLRTINRERATCLAVGATVRSGGVISVGDPVTAL